MDTPTKEQIRDAKNWLENTTFANSYGDKTDGDAMTDIILSVLQSALDADGDTLTHCPECGSGNDGLCETCYIESKQPDYKVMLSAAPKHDGEKR